MDGEVEADSVSPGEKQQLYEGVVMDVDDLEEARLSAEKCSTKTSHKEMNGSLTVQHTDYSETDPELGWEESSGLLPVYPICVAQDKCTMREEKEENIKDNLLHSWCPAEGSIVQINPTSEYWVCLDNQHNPADCHVNIPASPSDPLISDKSYVFAAIQGSITAIGSPDISSFNGDTWSLTGSPYTSVTSSIWEALRSSSSSPPPSDQDPVSAAAHLHLLGESLSLIGRHLQETNKTTCMSSSLSLLLDSLLCALAPLMCLTTQVPELLNCTEQTLASTLENISYMMPGL